MKREAVWMVGLLLLAGWLVTTTGRARGQEEGYKLTQGALVGGGGTLERGGYSLTGAFGQPVAGAAGQTGACGYAVDTGLYGGVATPPGLIIMEVDDDFTASTPCWNTSRFPTIQAALAAVPPEGMVLVASGRYSGTVALTSTITVSMTSGIDLAGDLLIENGTLLAPRGVLTVTGSITQSGGVFATNGGTLRLTGDWVAAGGTFAAQGGTVQLIGGDQAIRGTTTFFNLTKEASRAAVLTWPSGLTQTVAGTLTLRGVAGQPLTLRSDQAGNPWRIDPQSARRLAFLDVRDSANVNSTEIDATDGTITDSGNNRGWRFGGAGQSLYLPFLQYP